MAVSRRAGVRGPEITTPYRLDWSKAFHNWATVGLDRGALVEDERKATAKAAHVGHGLIAAGSGNRWRSPLTSARKRLDPTRQRVATSLRSAMTAAITLRMLFEQCRDMDAS